MFSKINTEMGAMLLMHFLCFFWPPFMAAVFLAFLSKRIKSKVAYFVFATLVLFGISRLVSSEFVPILVGMMPRGVFRLDSIDQVHWLGQIMAALAGILALLSMSKHFSFNRTWNAETKSWEWGQRVDATQPSNEL